MAKRMINRDMVIIDRKLISDMVNGTITVKSSGKLIMEGLVNKDIILERDAVVKIYGTVKGNVINNGGELEVYGKVHGDLITKSGETAIDKKASVGNIIE